jgi:hypothetical protein
MSKQDVTTRDQKNCNNGHHAYVLEQVIDGDPFLLVTIKWKCILCDKKVTKYVKPYD